MTQYIRYFIFTITFFISMTGYAVDHITCTLTNKGIPDKSQAGQTYTNTYTCTSTYPASFPAIQLVGTVDNPAATVTGSCATQKLASGRSCQFMLNVTPKKGTQTYRLQVSVGSLYYINLPAVTTTATSQPSSPTITWPGFNSGFAQADSTENGFGGFLANATDSSGHTVTYTFAIISGPGVIVGIQSGYFTLAGVNGTTVIQITATADDAAPVAGTPFTVQVSPIPIKSIAFHNNSTETIYPVFEAPIQNVDAWMQGLFAVTNVGTDTFTATKLHRAYVNGTVGIPPGQTTVVSVPFYSDLVANPSGGSVPDQYVDWWKSMRVYLYDVQSNLIASQSYAGGTPITLQSPGITCISGCTAPTSYFSATGILPLNDPYQLTEYTFASVITGSPPPYPTYLVQINYDISGVDQIYLPAAMGPFGSNLVGYMGSTATLNNFRTNLSDFVTQTGWPVYANLPFPRVPGAFNAMVGGSSLTSNTAVTTLLTNNWNACIAANDPNCLAVNNLFQNNWTACGNPGSPPTAQLLTNIYGYASFCAAQVLPSSGAAFNSYIALQYNYLTMPPGYVEDFNPYTQLIHQTLNMNVYAFSVDDSVAFVSTTGNGLNITVGGADGLTNQLQFSNSAVTVVSPGTPATSPFFTNFGVCCPSSGQTPDCAGTAPNQFAVGGSITIEYPQDYYPCQITLQDSLSRVYQFTLNSVAPLSQANITSCSSPASNPAWCTQFGFSNPPAVPQSIVSTGPP
ncbi:thaumatin domain-containing protein [Legionella steigerwaltii]|uniref:Thaumatin domain-containing protein n=1 Tax=Legionella steigerwaltii TaxID=460 RepID=A0A378LFS3_9GAMM|nr:hypothetical protein [Legionella steigerwaltii]KTD79496.1 thaumatin domain-containing protein [Legionella steigerwaltii]STY24619.1 thaumatin domain-containing protein [Legionella steigerwaltii]